MTEAELVERGNQRKHIFINFCNGVPFEDIMVTFKRSRLEVEKEIAFVARKIQFSRHKGLTGIVPILERIQRELAKRERDDGLIASLKEKASVLRKCAGAAIECDLLTDIRINRVALLVAVERLGPIYLSSEVLVPRVHIQRVDEPEHVTEINKRAQAA